MTVYQFYGPQGTTPTPGLGSNPTPLETINLTNLLGHEFGHLLGLNDDQCFNGLMNSPVPDFPSIPDDDCIAVDQQNIISGEAPNQGKWAGCPYDQQTCNGSPIVISLDEGPYDLTDLAGGVDFDIDGDSVLNQVAWTSGGRALAFLALDRNGNGLIDSGQELFGNFTPLPDGSPAPNGWIALGVLDDNHDGVIDENDIAWSNLLLWQDLNHDGISQASELSAISTSKVRSVSLDYHRSGRVDQYGNEFRYKSLAKIRRASGRIVREDVYDIYLLTN